MTTIAATLQISLQLRRWVAYQETCGSLDIDKRGRGTEDYDENMPNSDT